MKKLSRMPVKTILLIGLVVGPLMSHFAAPIHAQVNGKFKDKVMRVSSKFPVLNPVKEIGNIAVFDAMTISHKAGEAQPTVNGQDIDPKQREVAAVAALRSALPIVFGDNLGGNTEGKWLKALSEDPAWATKYNEGLKFSDAVQWLKQRIVSYGEERAMAINNAFQEVYGRDSTPVEQAYWDTKVKAKTAWYSTIMLGQIVELNSNPSERTAMIQRTYQTAMGRPANQTDLKYWLSRKDHYRLIVQASRGYLYSANGANDLVETVARALQTKTGKKPSDAQIKMHLPKYHKMIYAEMIKYGIVLM